jgi:predicted tellurium resistance membrane protein TerC
MPRYISWLVTGVAAAFLVVATAAFSPSVAASLAFAIGIGTLIVSTAVSYRYRKDVATLTIGLVAAIVSGWTIVASLVFSLPTVQNLALAGGLALAGLAIVGMTEHELENERAVEYSTSRDEHEPHLSAAA